MTFGVKQFHLKAIQFSEKLYYIAEKSFINAWLNNKQVILFLNARYLNIFSFIYLAGYYRYGFPLWSSGCKSLGYVKYYTTIDKSENMNYIFPFLTLYSLIK